MRARRTTVVPSPVTLATRRGAGAAPLGTPAPSARIVRARTAPALTGTEAGPMPAPSAPARTARARVGTRAAPRSATATRRPRARTRAAPTPATATRRPHARTRAVTALLALVLGLVALGTAPDRAAAVASPAQVAQALERSPVYIDPALDGEISPAAADRIERAVEATGRTVYVALVSITEGDRYDGMPRNLIAALRSRLRADGIYVASEGGYLTVEEVKNGERVSRTGVEDAESLANFAREGDADSAPRRTLLDRVQRFLANLRQSPERLAARVAAEERRSEAERRKRIADGDLPYARSDGSDDDGGASPVVVVAIVLIVLAIAAALVVRRRRQGAIAADGPLPVVPARVFEHARAAERNELREDADAELLSLATLLDEQPVPAQERAQDAYQRSLDAYTAARRRARPDAPTVDLVGILVLVDQARGDLAAAAALDAGGRPPARTPLCAFHPLHGRSARTVRWERGLKVPACATCAAAVRRGDAPDALRDGDRPYFEGDTVWAKTGFGAFSDDLVERVSRGE